MHRSRLRLCMFLVALTTSFAAVVPSMAVECDFVEAGKIVASDAAAGDKFGASVCVSGDVAVVGAHWDDDNGTDSGSAYLFRYDGSVWVEEAKLTAADGEAVVHFGYSVSVSGDVAVVGARWDDDNGTASGSAYVFRYDGGDWVEEAKLTPSDAAAGDNFGTSVSVSGDVAVVAARLDDDNGTDSGSAYVFCYDGSVWVEEAKLTPSEAAAGDEFGHSASVSGEVAVVGTYPNDRFGFGSGSAYVFRYDGADWIEEAKLTPSRGAAIDQFGASVCVSGDVAVVGAHFDDDNGTASGSAYAFRYDGADWIEETKLTAADGEAVDHFGYSVSVSGDVAIVGALLDDENGFGSGSAYMFRYDGSDWLEEAKLTASDGGSSDNFGGSVSVSGEIVVAAAIYDDENGTASGSAYWYDLSAPCIGSLWIRGDANSDTVADLADPIFILMYLAGTGRAPACLATADTNADGALDIADPVYLLYFLFLAGPAPIMPFPDCGVDSTFDLPCDAYPRCE